MMAQALRNDLVALQEANRPLEETAGMYIEGEGASLTLDDLNETERSAALIGASPDAFKPIPWMNQRARAFQPPEPAAQLIARLRACRPLHVAAEEQQPRRPPRAEDRGVQGSLPVLEPREDSRGSAGARGRA